MHRALGGSALAICAALAAFSITERQVAGQAAQANTYKAPRLADGRPNLNGIWQAMNTANYDIQAARGEGGDGAAPGPAWSPCPPATVLYLGAVGSVPGGSASSTATRFRTSPRRWRRRKRTRRSGSSATRRSSATCPGVPRATYMPYPFQIFQSQSQFFIAYEYAGAVRNIYHEGPRPAAGRLLDGSVGRAAGKARRLSSWPPASTTRRWFDRAGNFHSDQLKVTERYTRTSPDHLLLRGHDRGSGDLHAALEDQPAALPPHRAERAADGLQVRRVRRRADVRRVAEEPAPPISWDAGVIDDEALDIAADATSGASLAPASWRPTAVAGARPSRPSARPGRSAPRQDARGGIRTSRGCTTRATLTPLERPAQVAATTLTPEAGGGGEKRPRPTSRSGGARRAIRPRRAAGRRRRVRPARRATSAATTTSGSTTASSTSSSTASVARRSSSIRRTAASRRRRPRRASARRRRASRRRPSDAAEQRRRRARAARTTTRSMRPLAERCILGLRLGVRSADAAGALQQLQADRADADHVMILVEMNHDARIIPFTKTHAPATNPEVVGRLDRPVGRRHARRSRRPTSRPRPASAGATENLKVTERFSRLDDKTLLYRFTIDDPTTWTRPWTGEYPFVQAKADEQLYEYACHEGNHSFTGIMKGERLLDGERAKGDQGKRSVGT